MASSTPHRLRALGTSLAVALALTALSGPAARAGAPAVPDFADGFGLQVAQPTEVHSGTDFTLTVTTPQVSGPHKIRVFLPSGYAANPQKRWPVAYFLHGGGGTVNDAAAAPALRSDKMITVVPDGGRKGWYTNWKMQNTVLKAANWETFHLEQVVPFIDANLRTVPDRAHRAVTGLSMGGSGALHYAQARSDLFGHVAALSGGLDFGMAEIRATVVATELNLPGAWWLANTSITLYTGDGDVVDAQTARAARTVKSRLDQLNIPSRLVDYGNGKSLAPTCDGGHNYGCWAPAFADYVPRLQAAFAAAATR